jgi:hypothetical protein
MLKLNLKKDGKFPKQIIFLAVKLLVSSVADPDPGSGMFFDP